MTPAAAIRPLFCASSVACDGGLQQFLDTDPAWRLFQAPRHFHVLWRDAAADVGALGGETLQGVCTVQAAGLTARVIKS